MLRVTSRFPNRRLKAIWLVVERLAAKDQDRVLLEGRANLGPRPLIERADDIGAVDLRREHRGESGHDDLSRRRFPRSSDSRR
jgi:hypothetical protein